MSTLLIRFGKSSLNVFGPCLMAIAFIFALIFAGRPDLRIEYFGLSEVLRVFYVAGIIFPIILFVMTLKYRQSWLKKCKMTFKADKLKMGFLWLFGIFATAYGTLKMAIRIDCEIKGAPDLFFGKREISITNDALQIIFYMVQLGFISFFAQFRLATSFLLSIGLMFVLITNLTLWFQSIVSTMSWDIFLPNGYLNISLRNDCFEMSVMQNLRYNVRPYADAARVEYYLLAIAFIIRMWPSSNVRTESIYSESPLLVPETNRAFYPPTETTGLLGVTDYRLSRGDGYTPMNNGSTNNPSKPVSCCIYFAIGVILCLPMAIFNNIVAFQSETSGTITMLYHISIMFCFISHIVILLASFYALNKQTTSIDSSYRFGSNNIVLLFSTAGSVAVVTFEIMKMFIYHKNTAYKDSANVFITKCLLDLVAIFLQTVLLISSEKSRKVRADGSRICVQIEHLFLLLHAINMVIWFVDTFLVGNTSKVHGGSPLSWQLFFEIIYPVSMFYRFHVGMELLERYEYFAKSERSFESTNNF